MTLAELLEQNTNAIDKRLTSVADFGDLKKLFMH